MKVLIGRDPVNDPVRDRVVREATGAAMRDARRDLLERDVGQASERIDAIAVAENTRTRNR